MKTNTLSVPVKENLPDSSRAAPEGGAHNYHADINRQVCLNKNGSSEQKKGSALQKAGKGFLSYMGRVMGKRKNSGNAGNTKLLPGVSEDEASKKLVETCDAVTRPLSGKAQGSRSTGKDTQQVQNVMSDLEALKKRKISMESVHKKFKERYNKLEAQQDQIEKRARTEQGESTELSNFLSAVKQLQSDLKEIFSGMKNNTYWQGKWRSQFEKLDNQINLLVTRVNNACRALRLQKKISVGSSESGSKEEKLVVRTCSLQPKKRIKVEPSGIVKTRGEITAGLLANNYEMIPEGFMGGDSVGLLEPVRAVSCVQNSGKDIGIKTNDRKKAGPSGPNRVKGDLKPLFNNEKTDENKVTGMPSIKGELTRSSAILEETVQPVNEHYMQKELFDAYDEVKGQQFSDEVQKQVTVSKNIRQANVESAENNAGKFPAAAGELNLQAIKCQVANMTTEHKDAYQSLVETQKGLSMQLSEHLHQKGHIQTEENIRERINLIDQQLENLLTHEAGWAGFLAALDGYSTHLTSVMKSGAMEAEYEEQLSVQHKILLLQSTILWRASCVMNFKEELNAYQNNIASGKTGAKLELPDFEKSQLSSNDMGISQFQIFHNDQLNKLKNAYHNLSTQIFQESAQAPFDRQPLLQQILVNRDECGGYAAFGPLAMAAEEGQTEFLALLVKYGKEFCSVQDNFDGLFDRAVKDLFRRQQQVIDQSKEAIKEAISSMTERLDLFYSTIEPGMDDREIVNGWVETLNNWTIRLSRQQDSFNALPERIKQAYAEEINNRKAQLAGQLKTVERMHKSVMLQQWYWCEGVINSRKNLQEVERIIEDNSQLVAEVEKNASISDEEFFRNYHENIHAACEKILAIQANLQKLPKSENIETRPWFEAVDSQVDGLQQILNKQKTFLVERITSRVDDLQCVLNEQEEARVSGLERQRQNPVPGGADKPNAGGSVNNGLISIDLLHNYIKKCEQYQSDLLQLVRQPEKNIRDLCTAQIVRIEAIKAAFLSQEKLFSEKKTVQDKLSLELYGRTQNIREELDRCSEFIQRARDSIVDLVWSSAEEKVRAGELDVISGKLIEMASLGKTFDMEIIEQMNDKDKVSYCHNFVNQSRQWKELTKECKRYQAFWTWVRREHVYEKIRKLDEAQKMLNINEHKLERSIDAVDEDKVRQHQLMVENMATVISQCKTNIESLPVESCDGGELGRQWKQYMLREIASMQQEMDKYAYEPGAPLVSVEPEPALNQEQSVPDKVSKKGSVFSRIKGNINKQAQNIWHMISRGHGSNLLAVTNGEAVGDHMVGALAGLSKIFARVAGVQEGLEHGATPSQEPNIPVMRYSSLLAENGETVEQHAIGRLFVSPVPVTVAGAAGEQESEPGLSQLQVSSREYMAEHEDKSSMGPMVAEAGQVPGQWPFGLADASNGKIARPHLNVAEPLFGLPAPVGVGVDMPGQVPTAGLSAPSDNEKPLIPSVSLTGFKASVPVQPAVNDSNSTIAGSPAMEDMPQSAVHTGRAKPESVPETEAEEVSAKAQDHNSLDEFWKALLDCVQNGNISPDVINTIITEPADGNRFGYEAKQGLASNVTAVKYMAKAVERGDGRWAALSYYARKFCAFIGLIFLANQGPTLLKSFCEKQRGSGYEHLEKLKLGLDRNRAISMLAKKKSLMMLTSYIRENKE